MKISIGILLLFYLNSCNSVAENNMKADEYVGMTLDQVMKDLGVPDYKSEKFINSNYLPTPIEPIYSAHFSRSDLDQGITITIAKWVLKKNNISVIIWMKNIDKEWIVFSSLRYKEKKNVIVG